MDKTKEEIARERKAKIAGMTGANNGGSAPKLELDELSILGKDSTNEKYPFKAGHFKLRLTGSEAPKQVTDPRTGKEIKEYGQTDLGMEPVDVVFLKIRRVMSYWTPKGSPRTNEHNAKADVVTLFGLDTGMQIGTGYEIWERNQKLKTVQIVYAYIPSLKRKVRLLVKGLSLGMQEKQDGVTNFYEYLGSFSKDKLHSHEHITKLVPFKTHTPQGICWGINFQRGSKLPDDNIEKVENMIEEIFEFCQESDAYYAGQQEKKGYKKAEAGQKTAPQTYASAEKEPTIEYPEEEVDPADIPF